MNRTFVINSLQLSQVQTAQSAEQLIWILFIEKLFPDPQDWIILAGHTIHKGIDNPFGS